MSQLLRYVRFYSLKEKLLKFIKNKSSPSLWLNGRSTEKIKGKPVEVIF